MAAKRAAEVLKRQAAFLAAFKKCGTQSRAASRIGISRETVRIWRNTDENFEKQYQDADLNITGMLEDSAMDDALGELNEKSGRYEGGDPITRMFLLKARNPEKYRENFKLEHSGEVVSRIVLVFPGDKK